MTTGKHGRWLAALALAASLSTASVASAYLPSSIYEAQRQQAQQQDDNPYTGPSDSLLNQRIQLFNYQQQQRQYRQDQYDRDLYRLYLQNHWNDRR